jgi:hypothetical protein
MTPREFIKELLGIEITSDNESDDCDLEWTMIMDLMYAYRAKCIELNENSKQPPIR